MAGLAHQLRRDLLWVVNSPAFCDGPNVAPPSVLYESEVDQADLLRFMADRTEHRVGRYFEHLLLYWLTRIRQVDLVGNSIQLRQGKRTVGEIDFLYRDEQGVLTHCEATVKFFLHYPRPTASDFPGPNAVDNYERKTTRLFEHQLPISSEHYPDVHQRHAFMKGMVFYRADQPEPVLPHRMPNEHLRGRWLREDELDQLGSAGAQAGMLADKPHWLASGLAKEAVPITVLQDRLRSHFGDGKRHPVMISLFSDLDTAQEAERVFVVSDTWPEPRSWPGPSGDTAPRS